MKDTWINLKMVFKETYFPSVTLLTSYWSYNILFMLFVTKHSRLQMILKCCQSMYIILNVHGTWYEDHLIEFEKIVSFIKLVSTVT